MITLEESVAQAMDGSGTGIVPFLPYILQDAWEIGTDAGVVAELVRRHRGSEARLQVLDLGCGKGAVSVRLARELGCRCLGIDASAGATNSPQTITVNLTVTDNEGATGTTNHDVTVTSGGGGTQVTVAMADQRAEAVAGPDGRSGRSRSITAIAVVCKLVKVPSAAFVWKVGCVSDCVLVGEFCTVFA